MADRDRDDGDEHARSEDGSEAEDDGMIKLPATELGFRPLKLPAEAALFFGDLELDEELATMEILAGEGDAVEAIRCHAAVLATRSSEIMKELLLCELPPSPDDPLVLEFPEDDQRFWEKAVHWAYTSEVEFELNEANDLRRFAELRGFQDLAEEIGRCIAEQMRSDSRKAFTIASKALQENDTRMAQLAFDAAYTVPGAIDSGAVRALPPRGFRMFIEDDRASDNELLVFRAALEWAETLMRALERAGKSTFERRRHHDDEDEEEDEEDEDGGDEDGDGSEDSSSASSSSSRIMPASSWRRDRPLSARRKKGISLRASRLVEASRRPSPAGTTATFTLPGATPRVRRTSITGGSSSSGGGAGGRVATVRAPPKQLGGFNVDGLNLRPIKQVFSGSAIREAMGTEVLEQVRFPLMHPAELAVVVAPTGILTDEELAELLCYACRRVAHEKEQERAALARQEARRARQAEEAAAARAAAARAAAPAETTTPAVPESGIRGAIRAALRESRIGSGSSNSTSTSAGSSSSPTSDSSLGTSTSGPSSDSDGSLLPEDVDNDDDEAAGLAGNRETMEVAAMRDLMMAHHASASHYHAAGRGRGGGGKKYKHAARGHHARPRPRPRPARVVERRSSFDVDIEPGMLDDVIDDADLETADGIDTELPLGASGPVVIRSRGSAAAGEDEGEVEQKEADEDEDGKEDLDEDEDGDDGMTPEERAQLRSLPPPGAGDPLPWRGEGSRWKELEEEAEKRLDALEEQEDQEEEDDDDDGEEEDDAGEEDDDGDGDGYEAGGDDDDKDDGEEEDAADVNGVALRPALHSGRRRRRKRQQQQADVDTRPRVMGYLASPRKPAFSPLAIFMWGGGGASGKNAGAGLGGAGGYLHVSFVLKPGKSITVHLGEGGEASGESSFTRSAYPNGGRGGWDWRAGGGGGATYFTASHLGDDVVVAGAGGGGGGVAASSWASGGGGGGGSRNGKLGSGGDGQKNQSASSLEGKDGNGDGGKNESSGSGSAGANNHGAGGKPGTGGSNADGGSGGHASWKHAKMVRCIPATSNEAVTCPQTGRVFGAGAGRPNQAPGEDGACVVVNKASSQTLVLEPGEAKQRVWRVTMAPGGKVTATPVTE